ncbi:hypothetical protein [Bifidobacterium vansinderenii]|uniref:Uncharacterized protein n=1 Tax=Bifidobacterium vansinderenii TaxID=1984871 RepID=A0A229W1V5_9BIFI|nr:hypothetical protein [Bifidobacterium vansinderenii]OXN01670.1 hypothetical protein Tam10B_0112 [Bifidobacterium vansinderenii]
MGTLNVTGVAMGATSLNIASSGQPTVTASVPITVHSRNLLAYGPASANGLTCTVNQDGSLHVSGQTTAANQGVKWRYPIPDDVKGKTVTYKLSYAPAGVYCYVQARNASGVLVTLLSSAATQTLPEAATEIEFRVATNTTNLIGGDIKVQVEPGDTATTWMSPDVTNLSGGGLSLASLWPAITGGTKNGVTLTPGPDGSYTTGGTWDKWTTFESTVELEAGLYTIEGSEGLTSLSSWDLILQVAPYPSGDAIIKPGTPSARLDAGRYRCQININSQGAIGRSVTPRLTRID